MKQGFLILNQAWGQAPTFCRGNDYKWSLHLRHPLSQQLPFWLACFFPFLYSIAARNIFLLALELCHLTLQLSLVFCMQLNFLALTFAALCSLSTKLLALFLFCYSHLGGLFTGTQHPWKSSLISCKMTTTNESCSSSLFFFL